MSKILGITNVRYDGDTMYVTIDGKEHPVPDKIKDTLKREIEKGDESSFPTEEEVNSFMEVLGIGG